ncbi:unnamed protein product, partial [Laminaria digitata]
LEAKAEFAEEQHATLKKRVEDAQATLERLSDDRHKEELSIVNLERDLRRFEEEAPCEHGDLRARTYEIEVPRRRRASVDKESGQSQTSVDDIEATRAEAEAKVQAHAAEVSQIQTDLENINGSLTELKVQAAANREKRDGSRRNLHRIVQRLADVEKRLAKPADVLQESERELVRLADGVEKA